MLYVKETTNTVDEACKKIKEAAIKNKYGILKIHNLKEEMLSKGVDLKSECNVIEIISPLQANKLFSDDFGVAFMLPSRISVYSKNDKTIISTINPSSILPETSDNKVRTLVQNIENTLLKIMNEACA